MQKSKKIIIYTSIAVLLIIVLSLFYYSMRATIIDYFFANGQGQQEDSSSASGDQAQIMVDLANKQFAQQQKETEIREAEVENQSLFKELSSHEATIKESIKKSSQEEESSDPEGLEVSKKAIAAELKKSNKVQNGYVVVDCDTGGVIACPHNDVQSGTSPLFYKDEKSPFLVGRCLDVSIDVKTFCPQN